MSQWGVLSERGSKVKERVLSYPLPDISPAERQPVLIPLLIDGITNGSLRYVIYISRPSYTNICLEYQRSVTLLDIKTSLPPV